MGSPSDHALTSTLRMHDKKGSIVEIKSWIQCKSSLKLLLVLAFTTFGCYVLGNQAFGEAVTLKR